ncbi:MAG: B12-binding domain-containing radical SAM protein [Peptococcaceae bacterium]|jgi:radical SAM superfamily enzyme YgiQ (UPF0313 family)|nr:B12-binding domain-containing radical SAM protein [Peptococcaceae bacterium]
MNIVFINPSVDKYSDFKLWASKLANYMSGKHVTVLPKLVPMIMAALTPPEHSFVYIDEEIDDIDFDRIDVDFVAITAMTVQADRAYEIADEFRKRGKKVVIGGIHASVLPDEVELHADAVCVGEGENIWPVMLADFVAGQLKKRYEAKDYPPVTNLVSPRVDVIQHSRYSILPVLATKGCPYDCDFCSIKFSSGNKIRQKPVEQVLDEIRELEKYNKGYFRKPYLFVDDNLYINREYTKSLFTGLIGLNITWFGSATLDTVNDDEVLELMAKSGCRTLVIGFESISEASLKEMNKKANHVDQYNVIIEKLTRLGIAPGGNFIFGFDSDDKDVFEKTCDFILDSKILCSYLNIMTPYPGTRLYDRVKDRIFDKKWSHYWAIRCVFKPGKMTPEELDSGAYWAAAQVMRIDKAKRMLEHFWSHGPWDTNPTLNLIERAILLIVSHRLRKVKEYKEYAKFFFWAATRKNAVNMFLVFQLAYFANMIKENFS